MPISLSFGMLEALLADVNEIASNQRTKFQSRLRFIQLRGIPESVGTGRGRAAKYGAGEIAQLALAVELSQAGVPPERAAEIYFLNKFAISMAFRMAARALLAYSAGFADQGDRRDGAAPAEPDSMFLFFDPAALHPLMKPFWDDNEEDAASATFFYGGEGVVAENLAKWTSGRSRRLSLLNITTLLWDLASGLGAGIRDRFLEEVIDWAEALEPTGADNMQVNRIIKHIRSSAIPPDRQQVMINLILRDADHLFEPATTAEDATVKRIVASVLEAAKAGGAWLRPGRRTSLTLREVLEDRELAATVDAKHFVDTNWDSPIADDNHPEAFIRFPRGRFLPIDTTYREPSAGADAVAILDAHIDKLASAEYRKQFAGGANMVVLYVQSDSHLRSVCAQDPGLWQRAHDKNVLLAAPSNLVKLLEGVQGIWLRQGDGYE